MSTNEDSPHSSSRQTGSGEMNPEEKITNSSFLLAYFSTPDCSVCKALLPKVRQLIGHYPGLEFLYVDTRLHPRVAGQHLIFAVPTLIFFRHGKELKRFSRFVSVGELEEFLNRYATGQARG